jgi:hypothetical protein
MNFCQELPVFLHKKPLLAASFFIFLLKKVIHLRPFKLVKSLQTPQNLRRKNNSALFKKFELIKKMKNNVVTTEPKCERFDFKQN